MKHEDLYDALCRALTDYEGYGSDDPEVVGNQDIIAEELGNITDCDDCNGFARDVINTAVWNAARDGGDTLYDLGVKCQNYWDDLWSGEEDD